jgi:hypothetical protein
MVYKPKIEIINLDQVSCKARERNSATTTERRDEKLLQVGSRAVVFDTHAGSHRVSSKFLRSSGGILCFLNRHHLATEVEELVADKIYQVSTIFCVYQHIKYLPPAPPLGSGDEASSHCFPYAQALSVKIVSKENSRE